MEDWLPKEKWGIVNGLLVGFGQTICKARPLCSKCKLKDICPSSLVKKKEVKDEESKNEVEERKEEVKKLKEVY